MPAERGVDAMIQRVREILLKHACGASDRERLTAYASKKNLTTAALPNAPGYGQITSDACASSGTAWR
jgi:hypothetical protein